MYNIITYLLISDDSHYAILVSEILLGRINELWAIFFGLVDILRRLAWLGSNMEHLEDKHLMLTAIIQVLCMF